MEANKLTRPSHLKRKRRVGRGGKRGTYSGRGMKGQKSRAGHRIRPQIWDYILKTPKLKGMNRKSNTSPYDSSRKNKKPIIAINLHTIEKAFDSNQTVTPSSLIKQGVISSYKGKLPDVKILGNGDIKKSVKIKGIDVSSSAKEKIEKAGGSIQ